METVWKERLYCSWSMVPATPVAYVIRASGEDTQLFAEPLPMAECCPERLAGVRVFVVWTFLWTWTTPLMPLWLTGVFRVSCEY